MHDRARQRVWRRRVGRGLASVALGVVTSVGVAWVFAAWEGGRRLFVRTQAGWQPARAMRAIGTAASTLGPQQVLIVKGAAGEVSSRRTTTWITKRLGFGSDVVTVGVAGEPEKWLAEEAERCRLTRVAVDSAAPGFTYSLGAGWPLRCMYGVARPAVSPRSPQLSSAIGLRTTSTVGDLHSLPMGVLWGGLAIDSAAFAGAWWSLLAIPGALGFVRGALRARRGVCRRCGYDLIGLASDACPECGAVVGQRAHG